MAGQRYLCALHREIGLQSLPFIKLRHQLTDSNHQTQVIKRHRTHIKDNLTDIAEASLQLTAQLLNAGSCFLRINRNEPLADRSLKQQICHILSRAVVNLSGHPIALVFLCLDYHRRQETVIGRLFHLSHDIGYLRGKIAQYRGNSYSQLLGTNYRLLHMIETDFTVITLTAQLTLFLSGNSQTDLNILDRFISLFNFFFAVVPEV